MLEERRKNQHAGKRTQILLTQNVHEPERKNPIQLDPTTNSQAGAYNKTTRAISAKKGNKPYATARRALGRHDGERDPSVTRWHGSQFHA